MVRFDYDPLAAAIAPPPDETPDARAARLRTEAEARRVSDEIDEQLKQERASRRRQRPCVKVLLLGQSESGMFSLSTLRSDHVVNLPIFLDDRPSVPRKIDNAKKCVILFFLQPISFLDWHFLPSFVVGLIVPWLSIAGWTRVSL